MHGIDQLSKCEIQSGKKKIAQSNCRILHALHKLRKRRTRKTSVVQANLAFENIRFFRL